MIKIPKIKSGVGLPQPYLAGLIAKNIALRYISVTCDASLSWETDNKETAIDDIARRLKEQAENYIISRLPDPETDWITVTAENKFLANGPHSLIVTAEVNYFFGEEVCYLERFKKENRPLYHLIRNTFAALMKSRLCPIETEVAIQDGLYSDYRSEMEDEEYSRELRKSLKETCDKFNAHMNLKKPWDAKRIRKEMGEVVLNDEERVFFESAIEAIELSKGLTAPFADTEIYPDLDMEYSERMLVSSFFYLHWANGSDFEEMHYETVNNGAGESGLPIEVFEINNAGDLEDAALYIRYLNLIQRTIYHAGAFSKYNKE